MVVVFMGTHWCLFFFNRSIQCSWLLLNGTLLLWFHVLFLFVTLLQYITVEHCMEEKGRTTSSVK